MSLDELARKVLNALEKGGRAYWDKTHGRYKITDPETGGTFYAPKELKSVIDDFRRRRGKRTGSSSDQSSSSSTPPTVPGPARHELLQALENDANTMITILKSRLDPKLPVMTKFVEDVSWWQHLMLDFSKQAVPEVFSLMGAEDIDVRNPEATAQKMVSKLKAIKEMAAKAGEAEARIKAVEEKYRAELEAYKEKVRELEYALGKYKEVIDEQGKMIDFLAEKAKKTNFYLMHTLPLYLAEEDRPLYYMIVSKLKEIWCPEELAKAEQGRASPTIPSAR
jgi:arylsulfatase A-like enzyme